MKKIVLAFLPWLFFGFSYKAMAQDENKKEAEEIIIRKKGSKDVNINVQITGDKIMVNGKPLAEFSDDQITVNKKKVMVRDGNRFMFGDIDDDFNDERMNWIKDDGPSAAFLGVKTEKRNEGAEIVDEVAKESSAGKAGLEKGDIITKIDATTIDGPEALYKAVAAKKPKDEVKIYYRRNGKEKNTKAILGERKTKRMTQSFSYSQPDGSFKHFTVPMPPEPPTPPMAGDFNFEGNAFLDQEALDELSNLREDMQFMRRNKLGLKVQDTEDGTGVKVLNVEDSSAAASAGLKVNDVITEIGGTKVSNTDDAREKFHENKEKNLYSIKARRNGTEMKFDIKNNKRLKTATL